MAVRPADRQRGPEMELAERPVLVDAEDEADAPVGEVELPLGRAPLDGHAGSTGVSVHDHW